MSQRFNIFGLSMVSSLMFLVAGCDRNKPAATSNVVSTTTQSSTTPTTSIPPTVPPSPSDSVKAAPIPEASPIQTTENTADFKVENSVFARENTTTSQFEPLEKPVFKKGEQVNLVLLNVGKFKRGEDGKNHIDLDVELKDSKGQVLGVEKGLLGEKGLLDLPDNIAKSPVGTVDANTTSQLEPGTYKLAITIHDKIAGKSVTETKDFTIE